MSQPPPMPISPQPQRDVEPRTPQVRRFRIPVTAADNLNDGLAQPILGPVFGVVTRPRDLAHSPEMAFLITSFRQDAVAAMVEQALQLGARGVVGLRFDGGPVSETVWEITAYGTAVAPVGPPGGRR